MEKWQENHITKNLPELILVTEFNVVVKAALVANNLITRTDVEELDAESDRKGKTSASYKYYNRLLKSAGAYEILSTILEENKQTGAAIILKNGRPRYEIPVELDGFNDVEIDVQRKLVKIHKLFASDKLGLAQQIFQDTLPEVELYEIFVTKQKTFVLATSNIPPEPPIYIPRFLTNRIEFDGSIFKADCPDVFVFRNNVERYKLSQIARPHSTGTSTSQLSRITSRFIYLDDYEDWIELKNLSKVPIHLISYQADQKNYILEDTTAALDILSKVGSKKDRAYLSEDDFVKQQLSDDFKESSVCISDTPGMGKTFVLANLARLLRQQCPGRIIAFIQLSTFVQDFSSSSKNTAVDQEISLLNVFKYVSSHTELLMNIVKAELLQVEIFFDGFDEIPTDQVKWMQQVFLTIKSNLPNVRIYITSRPHMRHELEKSLGVFAYDILPFKFQNQVDYLVQFWSPKVIQPDNTSLQNYASRCIKEVNQTLSKEDKEMTGIPLLCHLIAEVYSNKINFYSTTKGSIMDFTLKIPQIYRQFIEQRIKAVTMVEDEIGNIKLFHTWEALKLLFPSESLHNDKIFRDIKDTMASDNVLKAGILQFHSSSRLEFMHRTFAEYFAADYFNEMLNKSALQPKTFFGILVNQNNASKNSLALLLATSKQHRILWSIVEIDIFVHSVIVSFVDFSLNEVTISEITKTPIASFCASISAKKFISILCACCHHNFYNMFSLLKEVVKKWNWIQKKMCFTNSNCYFLLLVCIAEPTGQMFQNCIDLMTEVLELDVTQLNTFEKDNTLLQIAVGLANYTVVEYFMDRVPFKNQSLLEKCVRDSDDIEKREGVLLLLLNKEPTLIQEIPYTLVICRVNVRLFKILVTFEADLTKLFYNGNNYAMHAADYMSPSDYHDLVQFFLVDCKADYLFLKHGKWADPLLFITRHVVLLPETMELLLKIPGIDMSMKDRWEESLLFAAVKADDLNELERLVDKGVDYNARDRWNGSLLHEAAEYGGVEMVRYLLSLKLDPNSRDERKWTPLHNAARYDKLSVVELLVENGVNVQAKDYHGKTALHLAVYHGDSKRIEIIRYLIRKGGEVNDRDNKGNTPLHFCRTKEFMDCLIEMGADIHAENKKGQTVLHMLAGQFAFTNFEEVIKNLIVNGLGVNDCDNEGNTPLHLCIWNKKDKGCLIEMGADIYAKNNEGKTPAQTFPHLWIPFN